MRTIRLCAGPGKPGESHCVMAATSIVAGEEFTDQPKCVCPTITHVLVLLNDACPSDEVRDRLLGHLPWLIIGTSGTWHHAERRAELFSGYVDATMDGDGMSVFTSRQVARKVLDAAESAESWEKVVKLFVDFIESDIIPVYTTMPVEPGYRIENLITR